MGPTLSLIRPSLAPSASPSRPGRPSVPGLSCCPLGPGGLLGLVLFSGSRSTPPLGGCNHTSVDTVQEGWSHCLSLPALLLGSHPVLLPPNTPPRRSPASSQPLLLPDLSFHCCGGGTCIMAGLWPSPHLSPRLCSAAVEAQTTEGEWGWGDSSVA